MSMTFYLATYTNKENYIVPDIFSPFKCPWTFETILEENCHIWFHETIKVKSDVSTKLVS